MCPPFHSPSLILTSTSSFFYPQEHTVEEGTIILVGDEKKILAYQLELDDIEAAVIPAISDL
jgi:hypothetical protein